MAKTRPRSVLNAPKTRDELSECLRVRLAGLSPLARLAAPTPCGPRPAWPQRPSRIGPTENNTLHPLPPPPQHQQQDQQRRHQQQHQRWRPRHARRQLHCSSAPPSPPPPRLCPPPRRYRDIAALQAGPDAGAGPSSCSFSGSSRVSDAARPT
eukprot:365416-Chlamydomonas_euryale.AAC.11